MPNRIYALDRGESRVEWLYVRGAGANWSLINGSAN